MTLARFEQANVAQQSYILGTNAEKRDLLISLGSNMSAHGKEVEFSTDFPFSDIANWRSHINGGPSHAQVRTKLGGSLDGNAIEILIASLQDRPSTDNGASGMT